jgi:hypothetical protein
VACHESNLVSLAVLISSADSMWPGQGLHRAISQTHAMHEHRGEAGGQLALFKINTSALTIKSSPMHSWAMWRMPTRTEAEPSAPNFRNKSLSAQRAQASAPGGRAAGLAGAPCLVRSTTPWLFCWSSWPRPNCDPGMTQHSAAAPSISPF